MRLRFVTARAAGARDGGHLLRRGRDAAGASAPQPGRALRGARGQMRAIVDGEERVYGPGETFEVPAGTPHQMAAGGPDPDALGGQAAPCAPRVLRAPLRQGPRSAREMGESLLRRVRRSIVVFRSGLGCSFPSATSLLRDPQRPLSAGFCSSPARSQARWWQGKTPSRPRARRRASPRAQLAVVGVARVRVPRPADGDAGAASRGQDLALSRRGGSPGRGEASVEAAPGTRNGSTLTWSPAARN